MFTRVSGTLGMADLKSATRQPGARLPCPRNVRCTSYGPRRTRPRHLGTVFKIGVPPVRIDILTRIDGVATVGGIGVFVLSRAHLILNKKTSGRLQDLADVERLERPGDDRRA